MSSQKPAAKKPVAKKAAAKKPEDKGKVPHRVPPRIIRRPSPNARAPEGDYVPVDTAKAVAFGMSIVQQMKAERKEAEIKREKKFEEEAVKLARRPTTRAQGQSTDIQIQAREIQRIRDVINDIIVNATGKTVEEVNKDTERDNFMTAEEAKAYGLVDEVIVRPKKSKKSESKD